MKYALKVVQLSLCVALLFGVSACAYKNNLRTPSQIKSDEAKKARKEARRAAGESDEDNQQLLPAFLPKDAREE